jgi:hypothetical protein
LDSPIPYASSDYAGDSDEQQNDAERMAPGDARSSHGISCHIS